MPVSKSFCLFAFFILLINSFFSGRLKGFSKAIHYLVNRNGQKWEKHKLFQSVGGRKGNNDIVWNICPCCHHIGCWPDLWGRVLPAVPCGRRLLLWGRQFVRCSQARPNSDRVGPYPAQWLWLRLWGNRVFFFVNPVVP